MERSLFFFDKGGKFSRSDVHMNGRQSNVSGIFELKLDDLSSKDLTGTARTTAEEKQTRPTPGFTSR